MSVFFFMIRNAKPGNATAVRPSTLELLLASADPGITNPRVLFSKIVKSGRLIFGGQGSENRP
jgi:hypothetical protein